MRILFLDQFSDPGGAQRCLMDLLPAVKSRGWEALVALPGNGGLFGALAACGVETAQIGCGPYSSGTKPPADVARFVADLPRLARQIRGLARDFRPDMVYINGPRLLPAAAAAGLRAPFIFHSHSHLRAGGSRILAGWALRSLRAQVVASCRYVAQPWHGYVKPERMRVIYNGVSGPDHNSGVPGPPGCGERLLASRLAGEGACPTTRIQISAGYGGTGIQPVRAFRNLPRADGEHSTSDNPASRRNAGTPTIGCIGRIAPEKGQREFLTAASLIHAAIPNCHFVLYGAPLFGDAASARYEKDLRRAAAGLPVEFRGWAEDVYSALANLDVLLVPSGPHEANPRVVLEAFAAAVPVIAFASGGIPEVIEEGRTGFLARDANELAACAVDLLTDSSQRSASIAQAARKIWHQRFTLERFQRQALEAMEEAQRSFW
jgi:glycosyltransferase involved in cell wall biosynthesis